jgi:hypothetical protein
MSFEHIKPPLKADSWCYTDSHTQDITSSYAWSIGNFKFKMDNDKYERLRSSEFEIKVGEAATVWQLECYPNGVGEGSTGNVCMYLLPVNSQAKTVTATISFEFVKVDGSHVLKSTSANANFVRLVEHMYGNVFGYMVSHAILKSDEDLLSGNRLHIYCEMKLLGQESKEVVFSGTSQPAPTFDMEDGPCWGIGILYLLHSGDFADAEIVCDGTSFPCHKNILAAASPVFKAMFMNDMKEKETGKIYVEWIDKDTISDMLFYIYGGKIDNINEKAGNLLYVSERYDLKQLKGNCEKLLVSSLKLENCLDYLIKADLHSAEFLKSTVVRFMVDNARELEMKLDWQETLVKFPRLLLLFSQELLLKHVSFK